MTTYAVKCPRCSQKAEAQMTAVGIAGTYRDPTPEMAAGRITCRECGYVADTSEAPTSGYELWYASSLRGHRLWAVNDGQLELLIDWLSGDLKTTGLSSADQTYLQALPKWILVHRREVVRSLKKMRTKGL